MFKTYTSLPLIDLTNKKIIINGRYNKEKYIQLYTKLIKKLKYIYYIVYNSLLTDEEKLRNKFDQIKEYHTYKYI